MKTIELKRKSWHYWLANFGEERVYSATDICSYIRYVIFGTSLFLLSLAGGVSLTIWVLVSVANIFSWLFWGHELNTASQILIGVVAGFGIMFGTMAGKVKMQDSEPGFVRLAYRSWKDKFCARIELK
jgi:hypothetical protein